MKCERCGIEIDGSYGSGRYCSRSCANSRVHSKETKLKISESMRNAFNTNPELRLICKNNAIKLNEKRFTDKDHSELSEFGLKLRNQRSKQGEIWGKMYGKLNGAKNLYGETYGNFDEMSELNRERQLNLLHNGTHKGWNSRNIKSYAELFWESVLDNNKIEYKREVKVGKYFLDFLIGNIDLEIDGKQHKYKDRYESDLIRDSYLRSLGYFVYRISWNEVNSSEGKEMMKGKIDLFLSYLEGVHLEEF